MSRASPPLSARQRTDYLLARLLTALPSPLQRRLAGGGAVERGGVTLAPEVQILLAARRWVRAPGLTALPVEAARLQMRRDAITHGGRPLAVGAVRDLEIDGGAGPLLARHYAPSSPDGAPLLLFLHGGGFVLGDLDTHDAPCRLLCRSAAVHVLSIDYRLAPEHPFPAAVEDAVAAFDWAVAHAATLGADTTRVAVGGDSAGANLAAVVAQARRRGPQPPALQLLLYPVVDCDHATASMELFADGFLLTRDDIARFQAHCLDGTGADARDPRVSPACAADLSGLAPALIATAGFDPLRDEGERYADQLRAAGTPATLRRFDGLVHGFANMTGISPLSRAAMIGLARTLRALLDAPPRSVPAPSERSRATHFDPGATA